MADKMSRRRWASLGVAPLLAQSQAPSQAPPSTEDLNIQRENLARWRQQLKQAKLPMAIEPAFQFKA
ncbi:MAG: hypothetical protein JNK48_30975 [Bryobacterales bacterium]|nr:hypothetical protein [Bryobacterales bacterium]